MQRAVSFATKLGFDVEGAGPVDVDRVVLPWIRNVVKRAIHRRSNAIFLGGCLGSVELDTAMGDGKPDAPTRNGPWLRHG